MRVPIRGLLIVLLLVVVTPARGERGVPVPPGFEQIPTTWKGSAVTTSCTGFTDSVGQPWSANAFNDSSWADIGLAEENTIPIGANRYYRGRFTLGDSSQSIFLHIVSDDGVAVWVNGIFWGAYLSGYSPNVCESYGCINIPADCGYNRMLAPVEIPPALLRVGKNVIAVQVHNGGEYSYFNLAILLNPLWVPVNDGLTNLNVSSIVIDPKDSQTLYAGTGAGIFKSSNGGYSWSDTGFNDPSIGQIVIDPKVQTSYMLAPLSEYVRAAMLAAHGFQPTQVFRTQGSVL